jgi:hypothetical protein
MIRSKASYSGRQRKSPKSPGSARRGFGSPLRPKIGICVALLIPTLYGCGSRGMRWTESADVRESIPRPRDLLAYPEDGLTLVVNPPGFRWTPDGKAKGYRLEVRKAHASHTVLSTEPQTSTVFPPIRALEPAEYEWQVVYLDGSSTPLGRSKTRKFTVPESAQELRLPDIAALKTRLAGVRPRIFLAGERILELRRAIARGDVPSWDRLQKTADEALAEESYPEPGPFRPGYPFAEEWLRTFTPAKVGSAHLVRTALAHVVTGEPKYLDGARRWMMTLTGWDPRGITSHNLKLPNGGSGNDEASMPMLERMSFAWDWIGARLNADERARVIACMTERGNQVLQTLRQQDFLSHPFDNHSGRVIAFLGDAGLAFLGDIPEAEQWLDYVLRCYLTSYPGWGGDPGGWSQGMSYWAFYVYSHINFLEALRQAAGTDIFRLPFYRNTGYLPVYFHPPYAPQGGFGDGSYHPPSEVESVLTGCLAEVFHDPILKWQAKSVAAKGEKNTTRWREWFMEDVIETLREATASALAPQPPSNLEGSRYFPDVGWAAMHSALGDAENDVWAMFKSSRFGSFSHSHADQNTFQLYAYGGALAIDSGYYPSYGTPHDNLWTRQTRAHNGILINGRGQPAHTWEAAGHIDNFEKHGLVTLVQGQAAEAYNLPQQPDIARDWQRFLREPLPPMEPKVETFERTLAFVGSRAHPLLVVHDYLRTSAPTTFDWLIHALNPMKTDLSEGSIVISDRDVRVAIRLIASAPYHFEQRTGFPIQPEFAANTAYVLGKESFADQSHLQAKTTIPAQEMKFLAVLVPYRASGTPPEIAQVKSGDAVVFRIAGTEVAAWWGTGRTGKMSLGDAVGDGRLMLRSADNGKIECVVAK